MKLHSGIQWKSGGLPREKANCPLHHPLHGFRKLKSSHIRIIYRVKADASEVWVLMIGDRRDIWESEQEEILERYEAEPSRAMIGRNQKANKKKKR